MDKRIDIPTFDNISGDRNIRLIDPGIMKTASLYADPINSFISALQPKKDKIYVLLNAVSSGEYWGDNNNHDYFPDNVLRKYYKTYESLGNIYKNHKNNDPTTSLGRVVFSFYNPEMKRVELIIELNKQRANDIVGRIESGENLPVSMGMRTSHDICSICGHVARSLKEHCDHVKHQAGQVLPDGRKIYMINPEANFFDISFVLIGADPTAITIAKVASINKDSSQIKKSTITKKIVGHVENVSEDPRNLIHNSQPLIPRDFINQLTSQYQPNEILSTMLGLRMMPKKADFVRILSLPDSYSDFPIPEKPIIPNDINLNNFNEKIAHILEPIVPQFALTKTAILTRILEKYGELGRQIPKSPSVFSRAGGFVFGKEQEEPLKSYVKNPIPIMAGVGGLFYGYSKLMDLAGENIGVFSKLVLQYPWLLPLIVGVGGGASIVFQNRLLQKQASMGAGLASLLITVPVSYLYAGGQEYKVRKGEPVTGFQDFVRRHPLLTALIGSAGVRAGTGLLKVSNLYDYLSLDDVNKLYNDIIRA